MLTLHIWHCGAEACTLAFGCAQQPLTIVIDSSQPQLPRQRMPNEGILTVPNGAVVISFKRAALVSERA
jgi:hypothetical protein